jgi:hypothetical protein
VTVHSFPGGHLCVSIDLFLREEDAERALEGILIDRPDWVGLACSRSEVRSLAPSPTRGSVD